MKVIPVALLAHYQGSATTIAQCIKVTRQDGTVLGFTSCMFDLTISALDYSASGLNFSSLASNSGLAVDNAEIRILPADDVMRVDLLTGLWDNADWEIFEVNYMDVSMGVNVLKSGKLGEVQFRRGEFTVEARALMQAFQQAVGDNTSTLCRYRLGDSRCTKDLTAFTYAGMIALAGSTRRIILTSGWSMGDGWFTEGSVVFTSGLNANVSYRRKVKISVSGSLTLNDSLPFDVTPGDVFTAIAGCQKRLLEDCRDKFDNILNFGGEPHLPGVDDVTKPPAAAAVA